MPSETENADARRRICKVTLDERTVVRRSPEVEHERAVAIFDLIEESHFAPVGDANGPMASISASSRTAWSWMSAPSKARS
jgi:Uncharacterized protein conserved in bacteria